MKAIEQKLRELNIKQISSDKKVKIKDILQDQDKKTIEK